MILSIEREALKNAINTLSSSTKKKAGMITSCLLFEVKPGRLTIRASDRLVYTSLDLTLDQGLLEATPDGTGVTLFTLEEARFSQWMSNVSDEVVTLVLEDHCVQASCGSFTSPFNSQDADLFTANAVFESQFEASEVLFITDVSSLLSALSFSKKFVSTKEDYNDPNGDFKTTELHNGTFYSTNAHLFGAYLDPSLEGVLKIGQEQLNQVEAFLKRQEESDAVEVRQSENLSFLKISDDVWFGFVQPTVSLPIERMSQLPTELEERHLWVVDKKELKAALGALQATAEETETLIQGTLEGSGELSTLTLCMRTMKRNKPAQVELVVNRTSEHDEGVAFSFDVSTFKPTLNAFEGELTMAFTEDNGYLKFHQEQDTGTTKVVIMSLSRT